MGRKMTRALVLVTIGLFFFSRAMASPFPPASLASLALRSIVKERPGHGPLRSKRAREQLCTDSHHIPLALALDHGHLTARGRARGLDPAVWTNVLIMNGPGNGIDGAHLVAYDADARLVILEVQHSAILPSDFHLAIDLPLDALEAWINEDGAELALRVRGVLMHNPNEAQEYVEHMGTVSYHRWHSMERHVYGAVDGARVVKYDAERRIVFLRVDDARVLDFWLEIELPLERLEHWLGLHPEVVAAVPVTRPAKRARLDV
jgi:hypothetical protein